MRRLGVVFAFILLCTSMLAQVKQTVHTQPAPYIIITPDTTSLAPSFTDREFYERSMSVVFKVGSTQIQNEDIFISTICGDITPLLEERDLTLKKIFIRGAASPEGPYDNNRRLGRGRAESLLKVIKDHTDCDKIDSLAELSVITEDYGLLVLLMEMKSDADYETVKQIWDECQGDEACCKERLQKVQGGKLWKRLLSEYYPELRAARIILWFSEYVPEPEPEPEPVVKVEPEIEPEPEPETSVIVPLPVTLPRRHIVAARTNLVHDAFYMPGFGMAPSGNIQFEYYPLDGHYTANVAMTWGTVRKWDARKFWQIRDFQAELRRYFKGDGIFTGTYLGAYLNGDKYGIGLGPDKGWQGEGGGVGISLGHTLPLNKRQNMRLEFMVAAGFFLTAYDPYVYGNPITGTVDGKYYYNYLGNASDFKKRNHIFTWLGPTNLGIQLTYDIVYRKMSFIQR